MSLGLRLLRKLYPKNSVVFHGMNSNDEIEVWHSPPPVIIESHEKCDDGKKSEQESLERMWKI